MIGQTISHYKILQKLGEGGMGEVYLAEDTDLDRKVALKFLPFYYSKDPDVNARFKREAKAAAALNHPNIVTVYEIGEHEGRAYIAMEYVGGESLREKIAKDELDISKISEITTQICRGLSKAHEAGVVHRDIKPENIILDKDGNVKILDFGLAQKSGATKLTKESTTLGTLHYMSPEQCQSGEVDKRTDIWSVGIVLYEMICGKVPFQGEYENAISYSIMNEEPEPLARYKAEISDGLQRIVDKALDKDIETRYQYIDDLLTDLKRESSQAHPAVSMPKKRIHRAPWLNYAAISLFAILAVVVGISVLSRKPKPDIQPTHRQITFDGDATIPTLSPDGQFIAYASGTAGAGHKAMVLDLAGGQALQVYKDREFLNMMWSPDGTELLVNSENSARQSTLIPRLGGSNRKINFAYGYSNCWSPDGVQIASANSNWKALNITNKNTNQSSDRFEIAGSFNWLLDMDWSPLGDRLVILTQGTEKYTIRTLKIDGSQQHRVVEDRLKLNSPRWSGDGKAIYYVRSDGQTSNLMKIRIVSKTGKSRGIPSTMLAGLPFGDRFTLSRDNKRLLYTREINSRNLWLVTLKEEADTNGFDTKQLTTGTSWIHDPAISPDGKRIAFSIGQRPRAELYVMPITGGQMQQLTFTNAFNSGAAWSPDSKEIAFGSTQGGKNKVWRIVLNGGTPRSFNKSELSEDSFWITWAPGSGIVYQRPGNRNFHFLDPVTENEKPLVSTEFGWIFMPRFSPDEKSVALHGNGFSGKEYGLWIVSIGEGTAKFLHSGDIHPLKWSNDGDWIWAYTNITKQSEIIKIPADGGQPTVIATLPWGRRDFESLTMSPDEKRIVVPVTYFQSDVWLVENFDPENELEAPIRLSEVTELEQLTYLQNGYELFRQRKYAEAELVFRKGLELKTEHPELLKSLGWSLYLQRKYPEAEQVFVSGLKLAPENYGILSGIWRAALQNKNFQAAKQYNEKYLAIGNRPSRKVSVLLQLGVTNILLKDFIHAEKHFREALAIDSTNTRACRQMGYLFAEQYDYTKAITYSEKALAADSGFANVNLMAWTLVAGEIDIDRGVRFAQQALAAKPENWAQTAEVYSYYALPEHTLGLAYLKKGEYEKAVRYLEQVAAFAPNHQNVGGDLKLAKQKLHEVTNK